MYGRSMAFLRRRCRRQQRKGAVLILSALLLIVVAACVGFAIDVGYLCLVRTQAQACADAAALAAAWEMAKDDRMQGDLSGIYAAARSKAAQYAALNKVNNSSPILNANQSNDPHGQIVFGLLADPTNRDQPLSFLDPDSYNAVVVRVECTQEGNNAVPLFFARVLGFTAADVAAEATAVFDDRHTVGFHATDRTGNTTLMPFAVKLEDWQNFLAAGGEDRWAYDPDTQTVCSGCDGIPELKVFPQENREDGSITPGNFGTVNVGDPNNAASDLARQISQGLSAADLAWHGGELKLDPISGSLTLSGDPGMTASIKNALAEVVGQARSIALYSDAVAQGNQTLFTIVGFAGIRVMEFRMTGYNRYLYAQPAIVVDDAAITHPSGSSYSVSRPVYLAR